MKILVTGGCGFIGHELIQKLSVNKNNQVYSLDNNFAGARTVKRENVFYIKADTRDIKTLVDFKPDVVYHLGEYSRISTSFEDVEKVWKYNVNGTFQVLQFCLENNSKIIYAGSSSKFGNRGKDENLSPYAWVKSKNVELIKNFNKWFGLQYAIAYFFNVYGKEQISSGKYATVIGIFEEQYRAGNQISVVLPGTQKRYFTHIEDTIDGLMQIAKNGAGDGYCLCDEGSLFSIEEVARMFSNDIVYLPEQPGNRTDPILHNYRFRELGWSPKHSLIDYIHELKKDKK